MPVSDCTGWCRRANPPHPRLNRHSVLRPEQLKPIPRFVTLYLQIMSLIVSIFPMHPTCGHLSPTGTSSISRASTTTLKPLLLLEYPYDLWSGCSLATIGALDLVRPTYDIWPCLLRVACYSFACPRSRVLPPSSGLLVFSVSTQVSSRLDIHVRHGNCALGNMYFQRSSRVIPWKLHRQTLATSCANVRTRTYATRHYPPPAERPTSSSRNSPHTPVSVTPQSQGDLSSAIAHKSGREGRHVSACQQRWQEGLQTAGSEQRGLVQYM